MFVGLKCGRCGSCWLYFVMGLAGFDGRISRFSRIGPCVILVSLLLIYWAFSVNLGLDLCRVVY